MLGRLDLANGIDSRSIIGEIERSAGIPILFLFTIFLEEKNRAFKIYIVGAFKNTYREL